MLLNAEELLALVNGDAGPDRLADLLDRLEHCPDSAAALRVLVALRANREQAAEALQKAAEADAGRAIVHPSARRFAPPARGRGMQALRLAASIALVAAIGVWGATTFLATDEPVVTLDDAPVSSIVALATQEYVDIYARDSDLPMEQTSDALPPVDRASLAMAAGEYAVAKGILSTLDDDEDLVTMYKGMSEYFLGNYEQALTHLSKVGDRNSTTQHQADWYEANAMLALNRQVAAMFVLEEIAGAEEGYPYKEDAAEKYQAVCEAMGITCPTEGD